LKTLIEKPKKRFFPIIISVIGKSDLQIAHRKKTLSRKVSFFILFAKIGSQVTAFPLTLLNKQGRRQQLADFTFSACIFVCGTF